MKAYYHCTLSLSYQIDLYFPKHKLALEVDENGHTDGDKRKR